METDPEFGREFFMVALSLLVWWPVAHAATLLYILIISFASHSLIIMVHIRVVSILLIVLDVYATGGGHSQGCHAYLLLPLMITILLHQP